MNTNNMYNINQCDSKSNYYLYDSSVSTITRYGY